MAKDEPSSSSASQSVFCKICMETAQAAEIFRNNNCDHAFCHSCLSRYIDVKVQEKCVLTAAVKCPEIGCEGALEPELFKHKLPQAVLVRWADALCELTLPTSRRLFCAQCKVAWHYGTSCGEFRKLEEGIEREREEDLLLLKVAKDKNWKRCPSCKYFVEKTGGCLHITCKCGFHFCYGCGMEYYSSQHSACGCSL
ncbi:putative E3 ubiquitin-protein ligase [Ananas comosus]|uniref:RBR-type E3 ubiquitin transferase n=1 Tax=Ananas comosus TaxID=4615 RepID=A0A199UWF9_ANACO|nr:putative E3 ubiquitin-protein ligase [Ananas comosus]